MSKSIKYTLITCLFIAFLIIGFGVFFTGGADQSPDSDTIGADSLLTDSLTLAKAKKALRLNIGGVFIDGDSLSIHDVKFGDTFNSLLRTHFNDVPNFITQKTFEFYYPISKLRARSAYYISYTKGVPVGFHIARGEKLISLYNLFTVSSNRMAVVEDIHCITGVVNGSLWNVFADSDYPTELAVRMGTIFEHQIDFYHLAAGDKFTIYFKQRRIGNNSPQVEDIKYAELQHKGQLYTALYFDSESGDGYFSVEGKSLKTGFLRSPLEYGRISSRYNPRRFHPVLKTLRAHKGTDYAAPRGTPIRAVADGTVSKASYTSGNGNYVKIRHNKNVETQYLHMSKFATGIRSGVRVSKGQTIGYVGSTGLATGPHVCFRYWLNGKQVDHLAIKQPPSEPISDDEREEFIDLLTETQAEMKLVNKKI